ncbi:MAG: hypothetical protein AB1488_11370 [Nitrospirota bacterium]
MTVETGLLLLESVLLVATIILLLYSIKEGRARKNLLLEVGKATKILTRQEYFLTVTDSMIDAKEEIIGCITGRIPTGDDIKRTKEIIRHIEKVTKNGVRVKYLLPKFPDRLHIGYLYTKAGAEIRYSSCVMVHNIRYIVVDDRLVVIGIPESTGEKEATKKGYRISSEGLAMILKEHFYMCWDKNINYEEYVREIINQTGIKPKLLAQELQIDEKELERIAG